MNVQRYIWCFGINLLPVSLAIPKRFFLCPAHSVEHKLTRLINALPFIGNTLASKRDNVAITPNQQAR